MVIIFQTTHSASEAFIEGGKSATKHKKGYKLRAYKKKNKYKHRPVAIFLSRKSSDLSKASQKIASRKTAPIKIEIDVYSNGAQKKKKILKNGKNNNLLLYTGKCVGGLNRGEEVA